MRNCWRLSLVAASLAPTARKPVAMSCSLRCAVVVGGQQVAGDLLADELVVGLVGVEGGDDVVAVAPGVRVGDVADPRRSIRA